MKELTAIITSFNRPQQLKNLIVSIKKFYPDLKIIVAENGDGTYKPKDVEYYKLPFDCGLSFARNFMLEKVKTDFFLLLDDDFIFDERTKIESLLELARNGFDIVGGSVDGLEYNGILSLENGELTYIKNNRGLHNGRPLYDMVLNFFVAKTEKIRKICWDNNLKLAEHTDFFFRAREECFITFEPSVVVGHDPQRDPDYLKFRMRGNYFTKLFMAKHGIKRICNFSGSIIELEKNDDSLKKIKGHLEDIDFCVTTFMRRDNLERLLFSIAEFYPMANIYIADQNKEFDIDYYRDLWERILAAGLRDKPKAIHLGFDVGISKARNYLVKKTPGNLKLILEDDFVFTADTNIEKMAKLLKKNGIGVVGGIVKQNDTTIDFHFDLDFSEGILCHKKEKADWQEFKGIRYLETECVMNFAMFNKSVFHYVQWDEKLKLSEHLDFYLNYKRRCPLKIVHTDESAINHDQSSSQNYKEMRKRGPKFFAMMFKKNKIRKIKYLNGQVYELAENSLIKYRDAVL